MATATRAKRQRAIRDSVANAPVSSKARRQHELLLILGQLIHTVDELIGDPLIREVKEGYLSQCLDDAAGNLMDVVSNFSTEYVTEMAQDNFPWIAPMAGMAASN